MSLLFLIHGIVRADVGIGPYGVHQSKAKPK